MDRRYNSLPFLIQNSNSYSFTSQTYLPHDFGLVDSTAENRDVVGEARDVHGEVIDTLCFLK
jgi:hypothetical protein